MTTQFDAWLAGDGPVALTIMEPLEPATGDQGVFFPPTFAHLLEMRNLPT